MSRCKSISSMGTCPMTRRQFLIAGCAGCAAFSAPSFLPAAPVKEKIRIRIIYSLHGEQQTRPDWPNIGFDFRPVMQNIQTVLTQKYPDFEFATSMAKGPEEAKAILEQDQLTVVDGYLVYQMNCWNNVVETMVKTDKPVLYVDFPYAGSGGFLRYTSKLISSNKEANGSCTNFGFVSSSQMEDVVEAVQCFRVVKKGSSSLNFAQMTTQVRLGRTSKPGDLAYADDPVRCLSPEECIRRMKESKILAIKSNEIKPGTSILGIPVEYIGFSELNEAWKTADKNLSCTIADRWHNTASSIQEVPRETLEKSAAMYLAMKSVLQKHSANAITINCLGGFYGNHIQAYPCLGFHELCNEGLVGGCECDLNSTAGMVLFSIMTQGRPGYISDPVLDTSRRQIIYAHCVASNKVFGPQGPSNPFSIMTHSEDRQGAAVRSILPVNYMTTTIQVSEKRKGILLHQAKAVDNDPNDRACRTKLAAEPIGDFEMLFRFWSDWTWHRVTAYGDLKEPIRALAKSIGWNLVLET